MSTELTHAHVLHNQTVIAVSALRGILRAIERLGVSTQPELCGLVHAAEIVVDRLDQAADEFDQADITAPA